MTINKEKLLAPHFIFIFYMLAASLLIMIFRLIFPGSAPPLSIFSRNWRVVQGFLDIFDLFPALAFSALVIPFGLISSGFNSAEENYKSFSQALFKRLFTSVLTAIVAAGLYCAILFLVSPLVKNYEDNMRFKGELFQYAKGKAQGFSKTGDWQEVSHFIDVCDSIWPNSSESKDKSNDLLKELKTEANIQLTEKWYEESDERSHARMALSGDRRSASISSLPGNKQPLDAADAIVMAEAAFNERRFYDAHWLATLGERLAFKGSPEAASAARLAGRAWNQIESQAPNRKEENLYSLFNLKRSGYQAMNTGDWVQAYYIFLELLAKTPDDPDVVNFLAASEKGTRESVFFIDEMELSLGEVLTGAVFSLPEQEGRVVLRFSSLSTSDDCAYGMDLECMMFDKQSRLVTSITGSYAKLLPFTVGDKPQVLVMTRAIDRYSKDFGWEAKWIIGEKPAAGVILDISFEDFLLLSRVRHGVNNLQIDELFAASKRLGSAGYVSGVFEAEILNRLGAAVFFLPMAIVVIIIGWRFRAKNRPRYLFIPLLAVLPVIFHVFVFLYKAVFNILGVWLVLSVGFSAALVVFIVLLAVSLFVSLIVLSAQHS